MNKKLSLILLSLIICTSSFYAARKLATKKTEDRKEEIIVTPRYSPKTYDFKEKGVTLSNSQLEQHMKLYQGYVKKRNEIEKDLVTVDRSNVANVTYSPYRSLKIAEVFAHNAALLHELYFENLGAGTEIGEKAKFLLEKNFGSIENFKKDLIDAASCARGWVLTAYCLDDGSIKNFVLDAHHINVPVMVLPLLVVDIYEHAYMIDYGINRADYLKTMWDLIDWDVVESRITKWMPKTAFEKMEISSEEEFTE